MGVEGPMSPEELVVVVRHLQNQGFRVGVESADPLVLQLTLPPGIEKPLDAD